METTAGGGPADDWRSTVLIFCNPSAGKGEGRKIWTDFELMVVHPEHIFDVKDGGIDRGLKHHNKYLEHMRILVVGGDGTVQSVVEALYNMKELRHKPPVAILPTGVQNTIASVLGWTDEWTRCGGRLSEFIKRVEKSDLTTIDRWKATLKPWNGTGGSVFLLLDCFSLGFSEAKLSLEYHSVKERMDSGPRMNKIIYAGLGLKQVLGGVGTSIKSNVTGADKSEHLDKVISLEVNGTKVPIQSDVDGIVVCNLPSSHGKDMWGPQREAAFRPVAFDDGQLEVIAIKGGVLRKSTRLAQGNQVRIIYNTQQQPLPIEIDGEPWLQEKPAEFHIEFHERVSMIMATRPLISAQCLEVRANKCGVLQKLSKRGKSRWKPRWFALHEHRLYYFLDEKASVPKGSVSLECPRGSAVPVAMELDQSQDRSNCFVLHAVGLRWVLNASSAQEVSSWLSALQVALDTPLTFDSIADRPALTSSSELNLPYSPLIQSGSAASSSSVASPPISPRINKPQRPLPSLPPSRNSAHSNSAPEFPSAPAHVPIPHLPASPSTPVITATIVAPSSINSSQVLPVTSSASPPIAEMSNIRLSGGNNNATSTIPTNSSFSSSSSSQHSVPLHRNSNSGNQLTVTPQMTSGRSVSPGPRLQQSASAPLLPPHAHQHLTHSADTIPRPSLSYSPIGSPIHGSAPLNTIHPPPPAMYGMYPSPYGYAPPYGPAYPHQTTGYPLQTPQQHYAHYPPHYHPPRPPG